MRDERRGDGGLRNLHTAGDDRQHSRCDERFERPAEYRLERRMERVEFEQGGATVFEDLADHVGGGEAGHIACPEHDGHTSRPGPLLGLPPPAPLEGVESARIDASYGGPVAAEDHRIEQRPHRHGIEFDERGWGRRPLIAFDRGMGEPRRPAGLRQPVLCDLGLGPRREQQKP